MKTQITPQEYINIYEGCDWNPKAFSIVLKRLGYSDELIVTDDLELMNTPIKSLINVKFVIGWLDLEGTPIEDIGNLERTWLFLDLTKTPIQSLGNLQTVGGNLYLSGTLIQSLGNLQRVGGNLYLEETPISKKYSEEEIKQMVNVGRTLFI